MPCEFGCEQFPCFEDKCHVCQASVVVPREPPIGTYANTARMLVEMGIMDGDEADRWKDEMKDRMDD